MNNNSILNKVFSKIAKAENKTELASEKVELALLDDVKKRSKDLNTETDRLSKLEDEFFKLKRNITGLSSRIDKDLQAQSKDVEQALKATKELGLDSKPFFIYKKQLDEVSAELKRIDNKFK
tara:strand:- start:46 stop:411 length:366 start_codon:yes stop_codon:yes gene_type:complete